MKYRGKTHNSILTKYGVFNSLCINPGLRELSLLQSTHGQNPFLLQSFFYLNKLLNLQNSNRSGKLSVTNGKLERFISSSLPSLVRAEHPPFPSLHALEIEQVDVCHYLAPETCPFSYSMQMTHLSTKWVVNLEGSPCFLASKV
jgi:hypothetical protein